MAIVNVSFCSESLLRTVNFLAILPLDKDPVGPEQTAPKGPLRSLYLLHGVFGSEYDWITGTRVKQWATEKNLAVFMPAGENKFYSDNAASGDLFGRYVGEELVSFTRSMFPLSDKREDTYVAGLSMGGLGALLTGLRYPETFSRIGAFSSALVTDHYPPDDSAPLLIGRKSYFESFCGPEEKYEGSPNDFYGLAARVRESGAPMPEIYMACGSEDPLLQMNLRFRDRLLELGYAVDWRETPGGHEWSFWDLHIHEFLQTLPADARGGA